MYAKIENNTVVKYPYTEFDIKSENPNTSFPIPFEDYIFELFGGTKIIDSEKPTTDHTKRIIEKPPELIDGKWTQVWEIVELSEGELLKINNQKEIEVRNKRNILLSQTDWTQGKDIPETVSSVWTQYRQELRDITSQEGFPFNIIWPTPPFEIQPNLPNRFTFGLL